MHKIYDTLFSPFAAPPVSPPRTCLLALPSPATWIPVDVMFICPWSCASMRYCLYPKWLWYMPLAGIFKADIRTHMISPRYGRVANAFVPSYP